VARILGLHAWRSIGSAKRFLSSAGESIQKTHLEEFAVRFEQFAEDIADPMNNLLLAESDCELVKKYPVLIEGLSER